MSIMNPKLLRMFIEKDVIVSKSPLTFISPVERQIIYCVVSAANNCELCLSFHAAGLLGEEFLPQSDIDAMERGELPADENARKIAIATKYAIAHKGILLQREKEHLKILGISIEKYAEILFLAGQMHANNMLAVFCINEGCPVEGFLKEIGPFRETVYKSSEADNLD